MSQVIIYAQANGVTAIVIPADSRLSIEEAAAKDVPDGVSFDVVPADSIPSDRTFRNAWEKQGKAVGVNLPKAKAIAHDKRREAREAEFAPLDAVIAKQLPGASAANAEAARQAVRDKYAAIQASIDAANDVQTLKQIMEAL